MPETIILKEHHADRVMEEKVAAAELYPGHLLELTSADKVQKHSSSTGQANPCRVAVEDAAQGNGIDDAYAADDRVYVWTPMPGDEVYAVLADGENASIGSYLASNADGTLKVSTTNPVFQALEALNLSDSSGAESSTSPFGYDKRIKVKKL